MSDSYTYKRHLPHWRQPGIIYFVTFRLADSIPRGRIDAWLAERDQWLKQHPLPHSDMQSQEYRRLFPDKLEYWLDSGLGSCHFRLPSNRAIVEDALRYHDAQRYHLGNFVIMPNHVHALLAPFNDHPLERILHTWKSFTAKRLNQALGRSGAVWQAESYDHIVRSEKEHGDFQRYIQNNPLAVNLRPDEYTLGHGFL